jgi:hypothetical protein
MSGDSKTNPITDTALGIFGVAMSCIVGGLQLSGVHTPGLVTGLICAIGCGLLMWWSWRVARGYRMAVRASILLFLILIYLSISWLIWFMNHRPLGKVMVITPSPVPVVATTSKADPSSGTIPGHPISKRDANHASFDLTVVLKNENPLPQFFINGRPSEPKRYASGFATFTLSAGEYRLQSESSVWSCSAVIVIPPTPQGPIPANCTMK